MLIKILHLFLIFCCGIFALLTICSKSKEKKEKTIRKKKEKRAGNTPKSESKTEKEEDVKFDIKVKPTVQKNDEFNDDEENPLAKIPTKPRLPKQKTATTSSKAEEAEASFFAPHEKTSGASCYMVQTANKR